MVDETTVIKKIRCVLALPLSLLQPAIIVIGFVLGKLLEGVQAHVWWPILQAQRMVAGDPLWQICDLIHLGKQPRTDADRAVADASDEITKVVCSCTDPKCQAAGGPIYVPKTAVKKISSVPNSGSLPPSPPTDAP